MSINNLPAAMQSVIQQGYLEREFRDALMARLGFREIAERVPFTAGIGENITKTRTGLLPAVTMPNAPASNTDLSSGMTPQQYGVEQYVLGVDQYSAQMMLNIVTSRVTIADLFLRNTMVLGEQAARSVDTIAQNALFSSYMGGNTRITTALAAAGTTVHVDDVRGFITTLNGNGQPVPVSTTNPVTVQISGDGYSLVGVVADGLAPARVPSFLGNLVFSGVSTNSTTTPGGFSGTLTLASNVSTADGTLNASVVSGVAPLVIRPMDQTTGLMATNTTLIASQNNYNGGKLTTAMILAAKASLRANNVPPLADGRYLCYADPVHLTGIYQDPAFQRFLETRNDSAEYRQGEVGELLGVKIVETNLNPIQQARNGQGGFGFTAAIHRSIVCGEGALVEGEFTRSAYAEVEGVEDDPLVTVVDGIAHVTREPLDSLKQVVTQSWSYIGGFVTPTDTTANPTTLPTASNSAFKRAVMIESL